MRGQLQGLTDIDTGHSVLKVNQCRKLVDAVFLDLVLIVDADERDALAVTVVVDVFQFGENARLLRILVVI